MEDGAPEPHHRDGEEDEPVVRGEARETEADAARQNPEREKPVLCALVGPESEDRLHEGGEAGGREHEPRHFRVGESVVEHEKRKDRGQGARRKVHAQVAEREKIDEELFHAALRENLPRSLADRGAFLRARGFVEGTKESFERSF